jgi:hypothetical protein
MIADEFDVLNVEMAPNYSAAESPDTDSVQEAAGRPLTPDQLRAVDERLADYLADGRVTPAYARARLADDGVGDYSRGYVQQRLARLEEHSHATNLYDTGLYELVSDPRADTQQDADTDDQ